MTDELEKLLQDVRKTIEDNQLFLNNLAAVDACQEVEPTEVQEGDEPEKVGEPDEFEEL